MTRKRATQTIFVFSLLLTLLLTACGSSEEIVEVTRVVTEKETVYEKVVETVVEKETVIEMVVETVVEEKVQTVVETVVQTVAQAPQPVIIVVPQAPPSGPAPADVFFEDYGVNPIIDTEDDHLSTFAIDVDTASYTVMRRYMRDGHLPDKDSVRVEEYVNFFKQDYVPPASDELAFAIHLDGAPAPFGQENYYLLRVGIKGYEVPEEERKEANLVFVIDVSGSMAAENRLELVKLALLELVRELRPSDTVGIVVYGTQAEVVLEPTPASQPERIMTAITQLQTSGSTNLEAGLMLGYRKASQYFKTGGINRVIICSDGVANVGNTSPDEILARVRDYVNQGVYLSTVGFGMGNFNDTLMEQLADDGDGNYAYVDTLDEARRFFVDNLSGTLQVIAKDAKVQVDFNPDVVSRYRLLGYENREVADQDFRDDTVDAGEIGAGHNVTALYEVKFHPEGQGRALSVHVRYEDPDTGEIVEVARDMDRTDFRASLAEMSPRFRLSAAVAEYAELLRESYWAREGSMASVLAMADQCARELSDDADVVEFLELVAQAYLLSAAP